MVPNKKSPGMVTKPKKKPVSKQEKKAATKTDTVSNLIAEDSLVSKHLAGHMTPEEVERHLESRRWTCESIKNAIGKYSLMVF
jgi:hypothetical protein